MRSAVRVVALALTITATLTILNAAPATAQSGVSVFGGVVSSTVSGDNLEGFKSKIGFAAGLGFERAMSNGLSFNPEIMFAIKGIQTDDNSDEDAKLHLNYIEVPLLFRYHFQSGGSAQPFITAGPTLAYSFSCKIKQSDISQDCDEVFDESDGLKDFDFGLTFGAGIAVNRITISGRYDLGLANLAENSEFTTRNRAFMLLLGIGF